MNFTIDQLYMAYRKAKKEAFDDTNCAHGLKFATYEKNLAENLTKLLINLNRTAPKWHTSPEFIGSVTCIPKSVRLPPVDNGRSVTHCQSSNPLEQWKRQSSSANRAEADFRPVIDASVDFMIVAALWILEVGHRYDEKLDTRYAVGNRLRRWRPPAGAPLGAAGKLNRESCDLFQPYYTAYGRWRENGLRAMRRDLEHDYRIVAVTMDLQRFYHNVDASFLLHEDYLKEIGVILTEDERLFTQELIEAIAVWNQLAHDKFGCPNHGLPVGLTASGLIANVLLGEFDRRVVAELSPTYYARYVDDVFLVVRHAESFADGDNVIKWLANRLAPIAVYLPANEDGASPALQLSLSYAQASTLVFSGKKQKIFELEGRHGIDLIGPIQEQIRIQTSEHRDLPHLPDTESAMAHRALLVTSDATLEADALRKADAVTLRRSGFAMLLGDVDAHARDLEPESWRSLRLEFYGLAHRHLLTPNAFFDYYRYLPRVVGLMAACGDWEHLQRFVDDLQGLLKCLRQTCKTPRKSIKSWLEEACHNLGARMVEHILQSISKGSDEAPKIFRSIRTVLGANVITPATNSATTQSALELVKLDWSREPYALVWLHSREAAADVPPRPKQKSVRAILSLAAIDSFRKTAGLPLPYWPALAFPTRPIRLRDITTRAASLLRKGSEFGRVVRGLRGTWMPDKTGLSWTAVSDITPECVSVPNFRRLKPTVAITSLVVTDAEFAASASGRPLLTLERYRRLNSLLDSVVAASPRPNYVVLPELALPRRWMMPMVGKVLTRGVSVIAGLEYREDTNDPNLLHNEALVALQTLFPGYQAGVFLYQPKREPAWGELLHLRNDHGKALAPPPHGSLHHPVYSHQGFRFGVLICSELMDIRRRAHFQGHVDALFVPEWNPDVESFSAWVESAALDVHAFVVQANNRRYGDSRIRAPMKVDFLRDMVRVKGGINDYFVIGEIDYMSLRRFQSHTTPPLGDRAEFKPFPVNFRLSPSRRTTPR